jgi:hypothetical protein
LPGGHRARCFGCLGARSTRRARRKQQRKENGPRNARAPARTP